MEHVRSYWQREADDEPEPLRRDLDADVVVIGGRVGWPFQRVSPARCRSGTRSGRARVSTHRFRRQRRNAGIVETPLSDADVVVRRCPARARARWALACLCGEVQRGDRALVRRLGAQSEVRALARAREWRFALRRASPPTRAWSSSSRRKSPRAGSGAGRPRRVAWRGASVRSDLDGSSGEPNGLVRQVAQAVRDGGGRVYEGTRVTHLCDRLQWSSRAADRGGRARPRTGRRHLHRCLDE